MSITQVNFKHIPVMLEECINNLGIKQNGVYVDGTLGGAGHSQEIAKRISREGLLIGIDRDFEAIEVAKEKLKKYENVVYINNNHDNIKEILKSLNIEKVDGILLDLGVSSYQIDETKRGFSYLKEAFLDMRMDQKQELDAKYVVNNYEEDKLAKIIYEYGEEKFSRKIANHICMARKSKTIETTTELVKIIESVIPKAISKKQGHPAKKTFQAIRIEVNNEIQPLYNTIKNSIECLKTQGRLCVLTFHSLEDRAVKLAYTNLEGKCTCPSDLPYCVCNKESLGKNITKKPILPTEEELIKNSRSKSAKLRVFERS